MVARGQLVGVLTIGPKSGGEQYAPDELEAIAFLAQGVGTALDAMANRNQDDIRSLIADLDARIRALTDIVANRLGPPNSGQS
jgi:hypothetical protein